MLLTINEKYDINQLKLFLVGYYNESYKAFIPTSSLRIVFPLINAVNIFEEFFDEENRFIGPNKNGFQPIFEF